MSKTNRQKVLLKLQALVMAIGSDKKKFNTEIQAVANDIDELFATSKRIR